MSDVTGRQEERAVAVLGNDADDVGGIETVPEWNHESLKFVHGAAAFWRNQRQEVLSSSTSLKPRTRPPNHRNEASKNRQRVVCAAPFVRRRPRL